MSALLLLVLSFQEEKLRVDGPPFLVFGESIELRAQNSVPDAQLVWRVADAPPGGIDTRPSVDSGTRTVRGTDRLGVKSVGRTEGDVLVVITLERKGARLAQVEHRIRVGPVLRVRAWCKPVDHPAGGTRRAEAFRDGERRKVLEGEVNRLLRPLGVEVGLEAGKGVVAPDGWFDREGKFRPVVLKDGKKAKSLTLQELFRHDEPGGVNVYLVRDCHWTTVQEGFEKVVTEHSLVGIGMKDGQVVIDDSADAVALAHELGHAFSLDDLERKSERGRLMYSNRRDRTGLEFVYQEMKDARERARLHLKSAAVSALQKR